jgi:hypothetical protein
MPFRFGRPSGVRAGRDVAAPRCAAAELTLQPAAIATAAINTNENRYFIIILTFVEV